MTARRQDTHVQFDFDSLAQFSQTKTGLYCLSDWDVAVIKSALRFAHWPSRWRGGPQEKLLRDIGRVADLDDALGRASLIDWRLNVSNCDDLISVMQALAGSAGGGANCGCGINGAGGVDDVASQEDTGTPGGHTGQPPDGFDTWAEYDAYKCNVATWIVTSQLADVQFYKTVNLVGITVAGLGAAMLTPIPGDELIALAAFLVAITGLGQAVLDTWEDAIQNAQDDLICTLYNAPNAQQAMTDYEAAIDAAVDAETTDALFRFQLKTGWKLMTNFNIINDLFEENTVRDYGTGADCSNCEDPCKELFLQVGTDLGGGVFQSADLSPDPNHAIQIYVNYDGAAECGPPVELEITDLSGWTVNTFGGASGVDESFRFQQPFQSGSNCTVWNVYCSDAVPVGGYCVRRINVRSDTPFTMTVQVNNPDCTP